MKTTSKRLIYTIVLVLALGWAPRLHALSAPAEMAGKALVLMIRDGTEQFAHDGGLVFLPANSGNTFRILGTTNWANVLGHYNYTASVTTGTLTFDAGPMGHYELTLDFLFSDCRGMFEVTGKAGSTATASGYFILLPVPVPLSLAGVELRFTPDLETHSGTAQIVTAATGNGYTLTEKGLVKQGTYSYSQLNASLGRFIGTDSQGGSRTIYFGLCEGNYGIAFQEASQVVECVLVDHTGPKVTITGPAAGTKFLQLPVLVKGTAADNIRIDSIMYTVQNANGTLGPLRAAGTTAWTATIGSAAPGTNIVTVTAIDANGNQSVPVSRSFFYAFGSRLAIVSSGSGTVKPDLSGQILEIGKSYSLTGVPAKGYVCGGWSGDVSCTSAGLTFTMSSNMVLRVSFIPNPFGSVAGTYNGMFPGYSAEPGLRPRFASPATGVTNAGGVTFNVTAKGSYSAKVLIQGVSYSISGQFDGTGAATKTIARKNAPPLVLQLQVGLNGEDQIAGSVSDGQTWTSSLLAERAVFSARNPAPQTGNTYTFVIPTISETGMTNGPTGYSYGTVKVRATGNLLVSGSLSDGTPVTQTTAISKTGRWPLYLSLNRGTGVLAGWMDVNTNTIDGDVTWIKAANSTPRYYPAGFNYEAPLVSSLYQPEATPILSFTDGEVQFTGGNLSEPFTNHIQLTAASRVVNQDANKLTLMFLKPSGLFIGDAKSPGSMATKHFKGVVLQNIKSGAGYFVGTDAVGAVLISPAE